MFRLEGIAVMTYFLLPTFRRAAVATAAVVKPIYNRFRLEYPGSRA